MVVKSEIKHIKSLQQKKYRTQNGLFVAEGLKMVSDLLQSTLEPFRIYSTDPEFLENVTYDNLLISPSELKKMSGLRNPNKVIGVFNIPRAAPLDCTDWILVLDSVRDPGNLGTIIRLCDWYGIGQLVCSKETVDCYNPKVLQATMGSIARVNIVYTTLDTLLAKAEMPVYGAFMGGHSVYEEDFPASGFLVMGNEAQGISPALSGRVSRRVGIPPFGGRSNESLNVAMATAILLHEIRRPIQR